MKDRPIRPTWTKGVYPLLSDLQKAIDAGNLYIAMESRIIGAVIVTDKEDEAYRQVDWAMNTDHVTVIHLLASDPDRHEMNRYWPLSTRKGPECCTGEKC